MPDLALEHLQGKDAVIPVFEIDIIRFKPVSGSYLFPEIFIFSQFCGRDIGNRFYQSGQTSRFNNASQTDQSGAL